MSAHRTQCPHCQHQFTITDSQLGLKNGLARCSQCKQIFSAKDHLLPPSLNENIALAPKTLNPKKQFSALDEVFFDEKLDEKFAEKLATADTDITHHESSVYSSTSPKTPASTLASAPLTTPSTTSSASGFDFDILDDFDKLPAPNQRTPDFSSEFSPKVTNENPSANPTTDESWLEDLLAQEKEKELNASHFDTHKISAIPNNATDVASLLDEFGVEVAPEKKISEEVYIEKVNQRLASQPATQQLAKQQRRSFFPTALWSLGIIALVLGAIGQYLAYNRNEIVKNPSQASTLHALCNGLGLPCNLAAADPNAINVQVMALEPKGDKTDVTLYLTNQSNQPQLYPSLKLTLTANGAPVAQLIANPKQYLDDATIRMNPQQIKPAKLRLDISKLKFDKITIEKLY